MTRGTRVGATVAGYILVFGPVTWMLWPLLAAIGVAAALLGAAAVLVGGWLRDRRHAEAAGDGAAGCTQVVSLAAFREARAEPPAAGRLAIVTELGARRHDGSALPLAR
ncbi:MAG: hypothetical protein HY996_09390 [Micrococcales bacterium]|nr:hypothetical protein [Micrococcales bacterium]